MTKHKNKILILFCAVVLIVSLGVWHAAEAADSSVYVDPSEASQKVGDSFVISVKVDPAGQNVCLVEGELNLSNLICRQIKIGDGISPQLFPSCEDLSFMLEIQGCTTEKKTLLTVTVEAESIGTGTASLTDVDVVGEGVPVPFTTASGSYELTLTTVTPEAPEVSACECGDWGEWEWQNSTCGGSICSSAQKLQSQMRTCAPLGCDISINTRCVDDSSCVVPVVGEKKQEKRDVSGIETIIELDKEDTDTGEDIELEDALLADVGSSSSESTLSTVVIILALIVLIETWAIVWLASKKKKKGIVSNIEQYHQ